MKKTKILIFYLKGETPPVIQTGEKAVAVDANYFLLAESIDKLAAAIRSNNG